MALKNGIILAHMSDFNICSCSQWSSGSNANLKVKVEELLSSSGRLTLYESKNGCDLHYLSYRNFHCKLLESKGSICRIAIFQRGDLQILFLQSRMKLR